MKSLLFPLAACAALGGCAAYDTSYGAGYGYASPDAVYGTAWNQPGFAYNGLGIYGAYPAFPQDAWSGGGRGRGARDRDRDGVPNRMDTDRDGDGVPNGMDARPNNPRRR